VTAFSDLTHHGDADLVPGLVDLAVNVRSGGTPGWLAAVIRAADIAPYPDQRDAVEAVAARHRRAPGEVLLTAGAAEAFVLLARALRPRHAVVVHPQFTEPEAALRAAGHQVDQVILPFPFTLDPSLVPAGAAGRRRRGLRRLPAGRAGIGRERRRARRAGGDPSLTKTWALAGLRVGSVLAAADVVALLAAGQPLWPVSTPALTACVATASGAALSTVTEWAGMLAAQREHLLGLLGAIDAVRVVPDASASFVLLDTAIGDVRTRLQSRGFAVRRGETFPGLAPGWIRVAVRDAETSDRFATALHEVIG
jgi:histidinol-phosphate aminotransferase